MCTCDQLTAVWRIQLYKKAVYFYFFTYYEFFHISLIYLSSPFLKCPMR